MTDEMRYGTRTHCKRRWTVQGDRPKCPMKLGYEWGYLYVAICPYDGDIFSMFCTNLDKECFNIFMDGLEAHLEEKYGKQEVLLIGDGASAHTAHDWDARQNVDWVRQPTACPEVNPVERFFEEIRKQTDGLFHTKEQVEDRVGTIVERYQNDPEAVSKLTLFPYFKYTTNE